jgi:uncharacterized membrane protein
MKTPYIATYTSHALMTLTLAPNVKGMQKSKRRKTMKKNKYDIDICLRLSNIVTANNTDKVTVENAIVIINNLLCKAKPKAPSFFKNKIYTIEKNVERLKSVKEEQDTIILSLKAKNKSLLKKLSILGNMKLKESEK